MCLSVIVSHTLSFFQTNLQPGDEGLGPCHGEAHWTPGLLVAVACLADDFVPEMINLDFC